MAFTIPKENYNGKVYEVELGVGDRAIKIGGESTLPFLAFNSNRDSGFAAERLAGYCKKGI